MFRYLDEIKIFDLYFWRFRKLKSMVMSVLIGLSKKMKQMNPWTKDLDN